MSKFVRASVVAGFAACASFAHASAVAVPTFTFVPPTTPDAGYTAASYANGGQLASAATPGYVTFAPGTWSESPVSGNASYVFIFANAAAAASPGVPNGEYPAATPSAATPGYMALAGTVPAVPGCSASVAGSCSFVAFDPYQPGQISTSLSGLIIGDQETVTFYVDTSEQFNTFTQMGLGTAGTPSTATFTVGLGGSTPVTAPTVSAPANTTGPWTLETATFFATSTTETLSFMETGTPVGAPPFGLLADVTVGQTVTPEPTSLALLGTGILSIGGLLKSRRRS